MPSLDSLAQPEDQSTSVDINAKQPPPPIGSDYEQLQTLETWLIIHPYREQRHFMEEFPAILNPRSEDLIEGTLLLESADLPQQIQELHDHLTLLREIRAQGYTLSAIRKAYVNLWGGLTLEIPSWLEAIEQQLEDFDKTGQPDQTAEERVPLLRQAIARAQSDPDVAPEMLAELQCALGNAWYDHPLSERKHAPDEPIACYEAALQVYTADPYPYQHARVQYYLARAYVDRHAGKREADLEMAIAHCEAALQVCAPDRYPYLYAQVQYGLAYIYDERITGDRRTNIEKAIDCLEVALQVHTRDAFSEEYAAAQNSLGKAYHNRIAGDRQANLEKALECYTAALQVYTLDAFPEEYAMVQNNLAGTYADRFTGGRRENLEKAIAYYEAALQIYTLQDFPLDFAMVQNNLGSVYEDRIAGERQENLEQAINCYEAALEVYTSEDFPEERAMTQSNLGVAYDERIVGDRQKNLERAIACYEAALQVRTRNAYPQAYAQTQMNLGIAYSRRIAGERWENLEQAIARYEAALEVYTREAFPASWAVAQNGLGNLYRERIMGGRRANLEQAIACYEAALQIYTSEAFPEEWANTQQGLGDVYGMRITGEERANLERAIACCEAALEVYTQEAFPRDWAITQNGLGTLYSRRIMGDQRVNLERAIACLKAALEVFTYDALPAKWADTQDNLGRAYVQRLAGDRQENLERAIACYEAALEVYTPGTLPVEWAQTQNHLGTDYTLRIAGDERANREQALACYEAALQVFTPGAFPVDNAMIQNNLGNAYTRRIAGDLEANREQALACYETALQVFTLDVFPTEHWKTQLSRAFVEGQRGNWFGAHEAYVRALEAEDLLVRLGAGAVGRDDILKSRRDAATREGFVLLRLGQVEAAAVAIERGRARGLAEALALDAADPSLIGDADRRTRYVDARRVLVAAQSALNVPLSPHLTESERRHMTLGRSEAYHTAQRAFEDIVAEIRTARDPIDFLRDTLDSLTILAAAERAGRGHALVYLVATPWGGAAVAALSANPISHTQNRFAVLELPALTDTLVGELIETRIDPHTWSIIGGFGHAQQGDRFSWLLHHWAGATFRERAEALHRACAGASLASTLDAAAQEAIATPMLMHLVDQSLEDLSANDRNLLANMMRDRLLKRELQRCLETLADVALRPLVTWLCELGATSITLIPCGWLALFPLAAAMLPDGSTMSETLPASVAPSARSLLVEEYVKTGRSGIYAIGDPRPTHQQLFWGEAEALTLTRLAHRLSMHGEARVQHRATRNSLIKMLSEGYIVDASCHGVFDPEDFLRSALLLANGKRLRLGDMLSREADLRGLRLLILSACETAILDLNGAIDEVRSLAVGMVQAGAQAVLASLWKVDEKATYLLMVRFAQEWFPKMHSEPPAVALARAQHWLRTATNRKLQQWRFGLSDAEETVRAAAGQQDDPDACPYADPFYWAGFQITGW